MVDSVNLGEWMVGPGQRCLLVAEAGVNHNGNLDMALQLVDKAAEAGADVVKFQTFIAEKNISPLAPKADYQLKTTGAAESQLDMAKKLELSFDAFRRLFAHCRQRGVLFLSTAFDYESADFLEELGVVAFKVPSGEITNLPFVEHLACKGKPLIISTGMSTLDEVRAAIEVVKQAGNERFVLLHCVSNYPADPADANLRAMKTMEQAFHVPVGYSDHTPGIDVSLAAVALGACLIEKHFTLDRSLPGPDHAASLSPEDLVRLVRGIRVVESALGAGLKVPAVSESNTVSVARRSLVAVQIIEAGTVVTARMIGIMRPGTGLAPALLGQVVGRVAAKDIAKGTLISWDLLR